MINIALIVAAHNSDWNFNISSCSIEK